MVLDIDKLSPAPWNVSNRPWVNEPDEIIVDNNENTVESHNDLVMCAMARNFLDIVMRRGWGVVKFQSGWAIAFPSMDVPNRLRHMRWYDPFTAVQEAEKWWVANMEKA